MADQKQTVAAVTGASGYIAGVLIRKLLDRGWTVHGTVRSLANKDRVRHLEEELAQGRPGTLRLFEADLLQDGTFKAAIEGAEFVFHTASPFQIGIADPQRTLVEPALKGTENVVREALAAPTVRRVVLTSSVAAVRHTNKSEGEAFDESDWNVTSTLDTEPYPYSKVLAERRAWDLFKEAGDAAAGKSLVTINPSFVLGPPTSSRTDSTSVKVIRALLDGSAKKAGGCFARQFACVDVDNVADAHIEAAVRPEASGRYILSNRDPTPHLEFCRILAARYPKLPVPDCEVPGAERNRPSIIDGTKATRELGIQYTPIEDSVARMAETLIARGLVPQAE